MEYSKLNLAQASLVKKEVEVTQQKLHEVLQNNPANHSDLADNTIPMLNYQNYKQKLISAVQNRIEELEHFYLQNSDDERAVLFEKERLKLRKILQNFLQSGNTRSVNDTRSVASANTATKSSLHASAINNNNVNIPATPQDDHQKGSLSNTSFNNASATHHHSITNSQNNVKSPSVANNASQLLSSTKSPTNQSYIYDWEDRSQKPGRNTLVVEKVVFEPTTCPGFYKRKGHLQRRNQSSEQKHQQDDSEEGTQDLELIEENEDHERDQNKEKFFDFQIILTHDEMTALAARRKKDREDVKLSKSQAAATSIHSTVPYVDPRRIKLDLLRPGHPDRWIHPEGMK
jgi:hypothetical protein